MILHVTDRKYLNTFAGIYNSANELFEENERGSATADIFEPQLANDENYIEMQEDGSITAFMSFHPYGKYYELTSLYIRRECQRKGIGHKLLCHFERQVDNGGVIFVKVLKNASWSLDFYKKNGYIPVDPEMRKIAESLDIVEKPWSMVHYKTL